ncbi:hypothetical protein [Clostridium tertium]|uniref:hypothetical protein n=1 Tax=Clostridium tertium TaxID=1559 RepID=UPI002A7EBC0A|nr:hypothetical protein [Clostridium tertium]MDY4605274.1 hypothetical protein [Clostridium tertium]
MEKIKEFLLETNPTNLSVIIITIVTAGIIYVLGETIKKVFITLKLVGIKAFKCIKGKYFYLKRYRKKFNIIKVKKNNRSRFEQILKEYEVDKSSYDFIKDSELKGLRHLSSYQKKIRDEIINDNKEKIEKEHREMSEKIKQAMEIPYWEMLNIKHFDEL